MRTCRLLSAAVLAALALGVGVAQEKSAADEIRAGLERYNRLDFKAARDHFTAAIKADPENGPAHFQRAKCELSLGRQAEASADLDKAVRFGPRTAEVFVQRGVLNDRLGRGPAAVADYTAATALEPLSPDPYRRRAMTHRNLLRDEDGFFADAVTAELLAAGPAQTVPEGKLAAAVADWLATARRVALTIAVPDTDGGEHLTVFAQVESSPPAGSKSIPNPRPAFYRSEVASEAVWRDVVAACTAAAGSLAVAVEWGPHDTPFFEGCSGVRVDFLRDPPRDLPVAPGRTLRLTREVMDQFRVVGQNDYPADRVAVVVTEAHSSVGEQVSSYHGLNALFAANPWLEGPKQTAFLVEAWPAQKPFSVKPLRDRAADPPAELVFAALRTHLIPSYVAAAWKDRPTVPLFGHEDEALYKLCNYLHWAEGTGTGGGAVPHLRGLSVEARNKASGQTFVAALGEYSCPLLFIGYGHVGPYPDDDVMRKAPEKNRRVAAEFGPKLKALLPNEPTAWLADTDRRSVASYLKEKGIGYVVLTPRAAYFSRDADCDERAAADYLALRHAQHSGKPGDYLARFRPTTDGCTTAPDADGLAQLLPDLADAMPDVGPASVGEKAAALGQLLGECGTSLGCFPAGTPVHTADGVRPIEAVRGGDRVWAADPHGVWRLRAVTEGLSHPYRGDLVTVTTTAGRTAATGGHPFWVRTGARIADRPPAAHVPAGECGPTDRGRWVSARDLRSGDELDTRGGPARVVGVERAEVRTGVYNLRVADDHTFAVGDAGFLVHNACKPVQGLLRKDEGGLRKNLLASSPRRPPADAQAHHLIPVAAAQNSAVMRHAATRCGYSINRASNGMFLSSRPTGGKTPHHSGSHPQYSAKAAERLAALDKNYKSAKAAGKPWSDARVNREIRKLENSLRKDIRNGNVPTKNGRLATGAATEPNHTPPRSADEKC